MALRFGGGGGQAREDPALGIGTRLRHAGERSAFGVHQGEAAGVPQLVAEVLVALGAVHVELDVAAVGGQRGDGEAQRIGTVGSNAVREFLAGGLFDLLHHLRLHQAAGTLGDQVVDGDAVDDVQRVEHVALALGHLLALAVADQAGEVDVLERDLSDQVVGGHDHADGVETLRETRDYLVVATTRPETLLGDTAVMVHPEDERYAHLIGRNVVLPLTGRRVPVIADDYVDRAFGTGVVKVTPAHDFNDYEVGVRHSLPMINLFTPVAALNENAPERFQGLDRYEARKAVLAELEDLGILIETKAHKLQVPRGDRTGQVIEPYLTDQWFVKMDDLAKRGLELVEDGSISFVPPNWINTYRHWMNNIQDWCISRQLWWGHRIPG